MGASGKLLTKNWENYGGGKIENVDLHPTPPYTPGPGPLSTGGIGGRGRGGLGSSGPDLSAEAVRGECAGSVDYTLRHGQKSNIHL